MRSRRSPGLKTAGFLVTALFVAVAIGVPAMTTDAKNQIMTPRTFIDLAKKVHPAVVSIKINEETREKMEKWQRDLQRPRLPDEENQGEEGRTLPREFENLPDWLKEFFETPGAPRPSLPIPHRELFEHPYGAGSGMIFRKDGYILTNRHVLVSPFTGRRMYKEGQITVVLHDQRKFTGDEVKVVATDSLTDLAVLKIDADNLPTLGWADSDKLEIGEWVMAIGDPLELTGSVSQGIVSGLEREVEIANYARLLQTTAIINPGNSGGPLVNLDGDIVGINVAIASDSRRWQGVGFAIPSTLARPVAEDLAEHGRPVRRGHIGIAMLEEERFPALAKHEGYDAEYGVGVREVIEGFPAAKAGLRPYDIIVKVDGKEAKNIVTVQRLITARHPGEKIEFEIFRDGKYRTITVTAGEWPSEKRLAQLFGPGRRGPREEVLPLEEEAQEPKGQIGLTVENYPKDVDASKDDKAVVIRQIQAGKPAANARPSLRIGDVILEVEKERVRDVDEFADAVLARLKEHRKSKDEEGTLLLRIRREDATALVFVPLPKK